MTREDVLRMAREAGHPYPQADADMLERFADLVAAVEREACARLCDAMPASGLPADCAAAIRARQNKEATEN